MEADCPGVLSKPSNVIYITETFGTTPRDVLRYIASLYNAADPEILELFSD